MFKKIIFITLIFASCTTSKINNYYNSKNLPKYYSHRIKQVVYSNKKIKLLSAFFDRKTITHNHSKDIFLFINNDLHSVFRNPLKDQEVVDSIFRVVSLDHSLWYLKSDSTNLANIINNIIAHNQVVHDTNNF
jgi:hypothetical protein